MADIKTIGKCDHCDADAVIVVGVGLGVSAYYRRGCLDHMEQIWAMIGSARRAWEHVSRPP